MDTQQPPRLFTPLHIGTMSLTHRIIMSPLTRARSPDSIPTPLVAEYYAQRATPGGLLISEGTLPSFMAGNLQNVPGIYTPAQTGRFAVSCQLGGRQPLSASATNAGQTNPFTPQGRVPNQTAKEMTLEDIKTTIRDHVHVAKLAIEAGFDCVEITAANGWLLDQFHNARTNFRTDAYGGSAANRARFTLELLDAVSAEIGAERTAVRFSPYGIVLMPLDPDPVGTFSVVLEEVEGRGLAYVCLTQPRTDMFLEEEAKLELLEKAVGEGDLKVVKRGISLRPFLSILKNTPTFASGNYDGKNCFEEVGRGDLDGITFGRWFISNPNLVETIRASRPLTPFKPETFYVGGPKGYTDYPVKMTY